jgi:DNA cross-link repair 1A protein
MTGQDSNDHVNCCLDGMPTATEGFNIPSTSKPLYQRVTPQNSNQIPASAFSKLMSTNVEARAWGSAAKSEIESRGKRAVERTCPFYKILFNGPITVDAFRYGKVPKCNAYFLSHFHSDHYMGLTSKWKHGPIYCSKVTANLVRSKLGVDSQWVHELPWEEWTEIPGTGGSRVRGLDANHCPGSMLFLFERGGSPAQRILHCGDFRADPKHLNHILLRPGNSGRQRLDVVYLDTTYLNPKYAFPSQKTVIEACAEICVSMNSGSCHGFQKKGSQTANLGKDNLHNSCRGRLLVVVGTYSIGKERLCIGTSFVTSNCVVPYSLLFYLGIAKALKSKIYAPQSKVNVIRCLEDPVLNALLTSHPADAQVHMTSLFEIRVETLQDYLSQHKTFSRIVGFRPSGWSYKPPVSRSIISPRIEDVLYSETWRTSFETQDMTPQRGSAKNVKCFAVPYSEHSSFRELCMFACALNIIKIIPTVNVGNKKSRDTMMAWIDKWREIKRKQGLFVLEEHGGKGLW